MTMSNKFLKKTQNDTSFGGPPEQSDATNSPTAAYADESRKVEAEWDPATPPSVGSTVILSDLNAERYQKWTKQRQVGFLQDFLDKSLLIICILIPILFYVIALSSPDGTL